MRDWEEESAREHCNGMRVERQTRALLFIASAQLLAMSLWFSASSVAQALREAWDLTSAQVPMLTLTVQIGFVVGALVSAGFNIADRVRARHLAALSALAGAVVNGTLLLLGPNQVVLVFAVRFFTGVALAGVYPSGLKVMSGWFREGRGMALGVLIGSLTIGGALPHLVSGLGLDWRLVLGSTSVAALISGGLMLSAGDGPYDTKVSSFSWSHIASIATNRGFRLATIGYLGHMWELYAAWTWMAFYIAASGLSGSASAITFGVIAVGGIGSWLAGRLGDRHGRTLIAGGSMAVSGLAAAATALVFGAPPWLLVAVLAVWGFTVISDSAQFSAIVTEVVGDEVRGTALTIQTALGFMLTVVTIFIVPLIAEATSWRWAFLILVPGPVVGVYAMVLLKRSEWAHHIAGGRG